MKELNEIVCDPRIKRSNLSAIAYVVAIILALVVLAVMPKQPSIGTVSGTSEAAPGLTVSTAADSAMNPELLSVVRYRSQQSTADSAAELVANPELKVLSYPVPAATRDLYRNPELKVHARAVDLRDATGSKIPGAGR